MNKTNGNKTQEEKETMIKVVDSIVEEHYRAKAIDDYFTKLESNVLSQAGVFDIDKVDIEEPKKTYRDKVIGTMIVAWLSWHIADLIKLLRRRA